MFYLYIAIKEAKEILRKLMLVYTICIWMFIFSFKKSFTALYGSNIKEKWIGALKI